MCVCVCSCVCMYEKKDQTFVMWDHDILFHQNFAGTVCVPTQSRVPPRNFRPLQNLTLLIFLCNFAYLIPQNII